MRSTRSNGQCFRGWLALRNLVEIQVSQANSNTEQPEANKNSGKNTKPGNNSSKKSGKTGGGTASGTELDNLPQNVQDSYHKYDKAGWQGNVSGQTPGTNAGRGWGNRDGQLPSVDSKGNKIKYKEFDVNNNNGIGRDSERFLHGSDGSVWYTDSHYGQGLSLNGTPDFIRLK